MGLTPQRSFSKATHRYPYDRVLTPEGKKYVREEVGRRNALVRARKKATAYGGKVRRLENGLLDIERKGRYPQLFRENAQSPLLRLPPEIRNMIFRYAVGGMTFDFTTYDRPWLNRLQGWKPRVCNPIKNCFSLLRVCRQIYSETALLPFSANIFHVSKFDKDGFDEWLHSRLPIEQDAITAIQYTSFQPPILTRGPDRDLLVPFNQSYWYEEMSRAISGRSRLRWLKLRVRAVKWSMAGNEECPRNYFKILRKEIRRAKRRIEAEHGGLYVKATIAMVPRV